MPTGLTTTSLAAALLLALGQVAAAQGRSSRPAARRRGEGRVHQPDKSRRDPAHVCRRTDVDITISAHRPLCRQSPAADFYCSGWRKALR